MMFFLSLHYLLRSPFLYEYYELLCLCTGWVLIFILYVYVRNASVRLQCVMYLNHWPHWSLRQLVHSMSLGSNVRSHSASFCLNVTRTRDTDWFHSAARLNSNENVAKPFVKFVFPQEHECYFYPRKDPMYCLCNVNNIGPSVLSCGTPKTISISSLIRIISTYTNTTLRYGIIQFFVSNLDFV